MKTIIRIINLIIVSSIILTGIYIAYQKIIKKENMIMIGKHGMAVILSGSMEKELSVYDLVIIKEEKSYDINDIVVYNEENALVVHRIVEINNDEVITKGDANNMADNPISINDIKGRVIKKYSKIGKYILYLSNPVYISLLIVIFSMINILLKKH